MNHERLEDFCEIEDPEVRHWAMIWKVAPQLQGHKSADPFSAQIITEVAKLRSGGKLTRDQMRVLDIMGQFSSSDSWDDD